MSLIVSRVNHPVVLQVVAPDGTLDSVNLQPGGRIELPQGYALDPRMATYYRNNFLKTDSIGMMSIPAPATASPVASSDSASQKTSSATKGS
jgi:hypothetical protein